MNANHKLLDTLNELGRNGKTVERLYARLLDEELFIAAYVKLYSNKGATTVGVDPKDQIDGMSLKRIRNIIQRLRENRWRWKPVRRTYIPKGNGQTRPLGIPSWSDKLVQEVMRMVLEAYYEPIFLDESHGFRPHRNCHTALLHIRNVWTGVTWFIEGDIKGCFNNIDHELLLEIVGKRIRDFRFLKLLRTMLKAGYREFGQDHRSLSGTPQGGVVSPILANIFLHELDEYVVKTLKPNFDKGDRRRPHPEYQRLCAHITRAKRKGDWAKVARVRKKRKLLPAGDPYDPSYRRLVYVRYADDFLIGVIGSRADCRVLKGQVKAKLAELGLEMSDEKTKITNAASGRARFLGYDIFKFQDRRHVHLNGSIQLSVPKAKMKQLARRYMKKGKPHQRAGLLNGGIAEIVAIYDIELRGYYNYYKLAWDVGKRLAELRYIMWQSLTRTLAWKLRSKTKKINQRFKRVGPKSGKNSIVVTLETEEGQKQVTFGDFSLRVDRVPRHTTEHNFFRPYLPARELTLRLKHNRCELCQKAADDLEVHHIRRLKDIRREVKMGKAHRWQSVMAARNRKTLVVCIPCHNQIHSSDGVRRRAG
jgi:group II intron reverse transcriptase/maturase